MRGINVECMRNECGKLLARRDMEAGVHVDSVAGVPDSGTAHAVGYSNESHLPFARPLSNIYADMAAFFHAGKSEQRNMIAKMKLIPVKRKRSMIRNYC